MIKTLIEIGKSLRDVYPMPLVEVPYEKISEKNPPRVLVVNLRDRNGNLEFSDAYVAEYSHEAAKEKYFFRAGKSQGAAPSLSFKLPAKPRTLRQRLEVLENLGYHAEKEEIAQEIEEKVEQLKKDQGIVSKRVLVVLRIDQKWPGENEHLIENFKSNFLAGLGDNKFRRFWIVNSICHGCGEKKRVYGGVGDLLKIYTVDKYGYAPELNPKIAWKQYALCEDCIFDFERGKRATSDYLTFDFYGKRFWLLPVATSHLRQTLSRFEVLHRETSGKVKSEFEVFEDRLLYEASVQKGVIAYHFVFLKPEQQALRILLHIEEILPSVLKKYVELKQEVEKHFNQVLKDAIPPGGRIHFTFFSSSNLKETTQYPGFSEKDFFNLVDRVFRRAPVSEDYLISSAMARIQKEMAQGGEQARVPKLAVLETLLSLEFLLSWGILKQKIGGVTMSRLPFDEFFEEHGDFFNHPAKKGLVLLGVLVQKFLNYQYGERKSTPFVRTLKNLRLDQKDIQRVFTALQNKMNEYDIGHYWPELRQGVSLHFIEAGDKWPLSPDEIGFYIAVGMAIYSLPIFGRAEREIVSESN